MVWVGDSCFETKESQSVVRTVWSVSIQVRVEVELRTERIIFGILSSVQKNMRTLVDVTHNVDTVGGLEVLKREDRSDLGASRRLGEKRLGYYTHFIQALQV